MPRLPDALIALVLALSFSVGISAKPKNDGGSKRSMAMHAPLFVSPAGMPFRTEHDGDQSPLRQWFSQADTNSDGIISREEMQQDFALAFAEYDTDGNGTVDAFEVRHYEQEIFPEIATASRPPRTSGGARSGSKRRSGGKGGGRGDGKRGRVEAVSSRDGSQSYNPNAGGAARFGLLPIYHPLLDADKNINWRVSAIEFDEVASERFKFLDNTKTGALTFDQLQKKLRGRRHK